MPGLIKTPGECESSRRNGNMQHSSIHILNNDVLLSIFHVYRLYLPEVYEDEEGMQYICQNHQRWWCKLIQVCRRWRNLILSSPSQLDLNLVCGSGAPVADMIAHLPPLPLSICYHKPERGLTAEDESGILLALSHRDRLRQISFHMLLDSDLEKFIRVMDKEFPILEVIYIKSRTEQAISMPRTFHAPNLRFLALWATVSLPVRSPLLTTSTGLVTLHLARIRESTYFPPNYLLTWLSLMPRLEVLAIEFLSSLPDPHSASGARLLQTQNMRPVTLTYLRRFVFIGTATYLEPLISRISAPSLAILHIYFVNIQPLSFTVPHLLRFIQLSHKLKFNAFKLTFDDTSVHLRADPSMAHWKHPLALRIVCRPLSQQVAFAVQILNTLAPVLSVVEQVTLSNEHIQSLDEVNRIQWRGLLRPFSNAKTLQVQDNLVTRIFRSLRSEGEEHLEPELLPNLEEVGYFVANDARDALTAFLNEREVIGHPVNLSLVDPSRFWDLRSFKSTDTASKRYTTPIPGDMFGGELVGVTRLDIHWDLGTWATRILVLTLTLLVPTFIYSSLDSPKHSYSLRLDKM